MYQILIQLSIIKNFLIFFGSSIVGRVKASDPQFRSIHFYRCKRIYIGVRIMKIRCENKKDRKKEIFINLYLWH